MNELYKKYKFKNSTFEVEAVEYKPGLKLETGFYIKGDERLPYVFAWDSGKKKDILVNEKNVIVIWRCFKFVFDSDYFFSNYESIT